ncbi:hypothetical protein FAZ19_22340 [Sphingobacterium alkalisoli]|uniref:Lipopolysaccharide biosynthesis protein n=1 Tax=Sphingobacterium alkalisoli TaxID=1874115 RepID=A0A4U0GQY4_9SPHI|nr:hypothetical protein [Sphingobacterium alkalisoli]TJY61361.1 hypothetical protein FAZ19_22340 [Sphingobacterium alkalisoli]GGH30743.1 hypothetical protein GCM10011418_43030 [Sphingobacterium alkalisoli]
MSSSSISKNTFLLYFKTLFNILIAFYSTKLVLQNLGVVDYGVYNLVAGFVSLFSFLKASLSSSTQRFISYALGKDSSDVKSLFSTNVLIHLVFSIIVVLLLLTVGSFGMGKLSIPSDKETIAQNVFFIVLLDAFITINAIPYEGLLTAKENFVLITILGVVESLLKLMAAIMLGFLESDRLLFYSIFLVLTSLIIRSVSTLYCKRNYLESKVSFTDFGLAYAREMVSFVGWNTFGAVCSIFRNQGLAVVLNLFFGVLVNASYAIANQINSQLSFFSQSIIMSVRPRLVKAEGSGDRETMVQLSFIASKFSFYLLTFFSIPLIVKMPIILKYWLNINSSETINFCRLIIILNLIIQLTVGISMSMQAVGKIKFYQIVVGSTIMLSVPFGYLVFMLNFPPSAILIVAICVEILASGLRLFFAKRTYNLDVFKYIKDVIVPPVIVFFISYFFVNYIDFLLTDFNEILQLLITTCVSTMMICLSISFFGLNTRERVLIKDLFKKVLLKLTWK